MILDGGTPQVDAGFVINVGDAKGEVAAALAHYHGPSSGAIVETAAKDGAIYRLKAGDGTRFSWALLRDYVIVT